MKDLLARMQNALSRFMMGRNGSDTLGLWALGAGIVCTIIDMFVVTGIISFVGFVFLVYALFRAFSRNIQARSIENDKFEALIAEPKASLVRSKSHWSRRSTTKYFKCKQCGQSLSVPKDKGTLRVTCPKCHNQFEVKS